MRIFLRARLFGVARVDVLYPREDIEMITALRASKEGELLILINRLKVGFSLYLCCADLHGAGWIRFGRGITIKANEGVSIEGKTRVAVTSNQESGTRNAKHALAGSHPRWKVAHSDRVASRPRGEHAELVNA